MTIDTGASASLLAATPTTPPGGAGAGAGVDAQSAQPLQPSSPFTPNQMRTLAQDAVERGQMTRAQADSYLRADGLEALPVAPTTPTEAVAAAVDAAFPPGRPTDFELPALVDATGRDLFDPAGAKISDADLVQQTTLARSWLAEARLPAEIGSSIASAVAATVREHPGWATMPDAQRQAVKLTTQGRLDSMWGEKAPAMIAGARKLVQEIEARRPGIVDFLARTGAGNSVAVIAQLAMHAERLSARRG